jgi:hypothetical protein
MKCCISALVCVCVCAVGRPSVVPSMGLINTLIEIALFNFDLALLVDFKNLNPSRREIWKSVALIVLQHPPVPSVFCVWMAQV